MAQNSLQQPCWLWLCTPVRRLLTSQRRQKQMKTGSSPRPSARATITPAGCGRTATPPAGGATIWPGDAAGGQLRAGQRRGFAHLRGASRTAAPPAGGTRTGQATPSAGSIVQISAGTYHTCGVKADGSGPAGGTTTMARRRRRRAASCRSAPGERTPAGCEPDGSAACWGDNGSGEATPAGATFRSRGSAPGNTTPAGCEADGSAACWGKNDYGQATPPAGSSCRSAPGEKQPAG